MKAVPVDPNTYPCARCGAPSTGLFEGVPVCSEHKTQAEHKLGKYREDLERMLKTVRETIRVELLEGKL